LAELGLKRGDSAEALETINRLVDEFPGSYYSPYGMKTKADMLSETITGREEAKQIDRTLLKSFQDYPFATEVRERLRRLEESGLVG